MGNKLGSKMTVPSKGDLKMTLDSLVQKFSQFDLTDEPDLAQAFADAQTLLSKFPVRAPKTGSTDANRQS